jgi:hypothetical protein
VPFNNSSSSFVKETAVVNVSGNASMYGFQNPSRFRSRDRNAHNCACAVNGASSENAFTATVVVMHIFSGIWNIASPAGMSAVVRQCPPVRSEEMMSVSGMIAPFKRHHFSRLSYLSATFDDDAIELSVIQLQGKKILCSFNGQVNLKNVVAIVLLFYFKGGRNQVDLCRFWC